MGGIFPSRRAAVVCSGLGLLGGLGFGPGALAAERPRPSFTIPYYEDRTLLKAIFTGTSAQAFPGGTVLATGFAATTVADGQRDQPEFTVSAPQVIFNQAELTASSTGMVRFATADGNFTLTGEGFLWQQKQRLLYISNRVETLLADPKKPGSPPVDIRSSRLRYDHAARLGVYDGTVRVESPEFTLDSGELTVGATSSNTLQRLGARRDVVFVDRIERSTATADRADYRVEDGHERLDLEGRPQWRDAFRQSRAGRYSIDRTGRSLRATEGAYFRLPPEALSQPGGLLSGGMAVSPTNLVEITASSIYVALAPETNQVSHILAETNVLIATTDGRGRSTADRAEYRDETGDLVLTGRRAEVRRDDSQVFADHIRINRRTADVAATTNAFLRLRLPITPERSRVLSVSTNLFAEVDASAFRIVGDQLTVEENVRARVLEDGALAGTLDCRFLTAGFDADRNVRRIDATDDVHARQFPVNGRTNFLEKELTAGHIEADLGADQSLQRLVADRSIRVESVARGADGATNTTVAGAQTATAWFGPLSSLERFVAQRDVQLSRGADFVKGDLAVYQATDRVGVLELTGHPLAVQKGVMVTNATSLSYDEKTEKITFVGPFSFIQLPTNTVAAPMP